MVLSVFSLVSFFLGGQRAKTQSDEPLSNKKKEQTFQNKARELEKKCDYQQAAQCYLHLNNGEKAAEMFIAAKEFEKAAEVYLQDKKLDKAVELFLKAQNFDRAANVWEGAGNHLQAAQLYLQYKNYQKAAENFEKENRLKDALSCYYQAKDFDKVANIYISQNRLEDAAAVYEQAYTHLHGQSKNQNSALSEPETNYLKNAANLYLKKKVYDKAGQIYALIGDHELSAKAFFLSGNLREAADEFVKSNDLERAIELYTTIRDDKAVAKVRGDLAYKRGLYKEAAEYYLQADEKLVAAKCAVYNQSYKQAGKIYEDMGLYKQAGEMYLKAKELALASACYQKCREPELQNSFYEMAKTLLDDPEAVDRFTRKLREIDAQQMLNRLSFGNKVIEENEEEINLVTLPGHEVLSHHRLAGSMGLEISMPSAKVVPIPGKNDSAYQGKSPSSPLKVKPGLNSSKPAHSLRPIPRLSGLQEDSEIKLPLPEDRKAALNVEEQEERKAGIKRKITPTDHKMLLKQVAKSKTRRIDTNVAKKGDEKIPVLESLEPMEDRMTVVSPPARPVVQAEQGSGNMVITGAQPPKEKNGNAVDQGRFLNLIRQITPEALNRQQERYTIISEIGRGGMATVYLAKDNILGRKVAYKVLSVDFNDNPKAEKLLRTEALSMARLTHPDIVTLFDVGHTGSTFFLAMEFLEGKTIKQLIAESAPLTLKDILKIFRQICRGLNYAHEQNVIHLDVKPGNIACNKSLTQVEELDFQVKLMDFGVSKVINESQLTQSTVMFTPHYVAPEQIKGLSVDDRTDIYSLGATMFELITGQLPFEKGDYLYHHLNTAPPNPREVNPKIPEKLAQIILRCLQKKPSDRFQTVKEIIHELNAIG